MSFEAKYGGRCADCGESIYVGDMIRYDGDTVVHDDCDPVAVDDRPLSVCDKCWLVQPCDCGVFG